jgi:hypothetical protein
LAAPPSFIEHIEEISRLPKSLTLEIINESASQAHQFHQFNQSNLSNIQLYPPFNSFTELMCFPNTNPVGSLILLSFQLHRQG